MKYFALVDCNNFFVSCERVFRPDLNNRPVVVLSNNDACVIARSNEAKALGVKMGEPMFKTSGYLKSKNVVLCSSNYELYGDMSMRVMTLLKQFAPDIEVYSIDEAFLNLSGLDKTHDLLEYGKKISEFTTRSTGIPVSIGIAPTKTLAKLCNNYSKKNPKTAGVSLWKDKVYFNNLYDTHEELLKNTDIGDVWGIGRKLKDFLNSHNIYNVSDFVRQDREWVRKSMKISTERTWRELHGDACIGLENHDEAKKQICTSRSFGKTITDIDNLSDAISFFASRSSHKLRAQNSLAKSMILFFRVSDKGGFYESFRSTKQIHFPVATDSTFEIIHYAMKELQQFHQEGTIYKKAGVIITEIVPNDTVQQDLFDDLDREKHKNLMLVMDKVNDRIGQNTIRVATHAFENEWQMKRRHLSRAYTTDLNEIIDVVI
ncbi:MAG: Y-family DNA polymerase [Bacteroidales bacterium]|jgi:DNA polymerase V|nr:Y-family DNA polymerase [Bacteroidales bacterium]